MSNLKALRLRIQSIKSTQKITSAMRMVATARLRRAQEKLESSRPYAWGLGQMLQRLVAHDVSEENHKQNEQPARLLILLSSDRGLCGTFNSNLVKKAQEILRTWQDAESPFYVVCFGHKGRESLQRHFQSKIIGETLEHEKIGASWAHIYALSQKLQEIIKEHHIEVVEVVYSRFRSILAQVITHQSLIPYRIVEEAPQDSFYYDLLEPSGPELLEQIQPVNFAAQLYRIFWESTVSEQCARMTAMDQATRNARDMIEKLQIHYNRTRQGLITKELIEVIAGAEAL